MIVFHAAPASATSAPVEILVGFAPSVTAGARARTHRLAGATLVRTIDAIGYDLVRAPSVAVYAGLAGVVRAEANLPGRVALPTDACTGAACDGLPGQWHLRRIGLPDAWAAAPPRASSVTIAVLDTRVDTAHPDWVSPGSATPDRLDLANARDLVPASRWSGPAAYHGTFVAGLAGAAAGNGRGTAGLGWNARIMPVTVIDGSGATDAATLAEGVIHAWTRGARVINLSLGIAGDSAAVHDAIALATRGSAEHPAALVVAAAGNHTGSAAFYPGSYPEVLSVSGTDAADRAATCSNHNANVSVSAPADRLVGLAPSPEGARQAPCGTSAAAPLVAGLAGQLFAQDPARTPAQVRALIESSADDLGIAGRDDAFGYGRINAGRALASGTSVRAASLRTTVAAPGGATTVTARVEGGDARAAQAWIGDADRAPVAMAVTDGLLRADLRLPAGAGPHTVWVRVSDGSRWSAASTGAALVDSRAPSLSGARADGGSRATGAPVAVTFTALDDLSASLAIGAEFRSTVTGAIVARITRASTPAGAQRLEWRAPLDAPVGHYTVKIAAADGAGNVVQTEVGTVVG